MKNQVFVSIFILLFCQLSQGQTPGTGTSPCNALQLYPQTTCGNTSGPQYAGYYQTENAGGANVTMTGTSMLDASCTSDNETTQAVEWLSVTATASTFTITNQTDYGNSPSLSAQEPRDYVIYSGSCNSLLQIQCFPNVAGGSSVTVSGLSVGQTYYIMASQSASSYTACSSCTAISTCITSTVAYSPNNDACTTPFSMTTNVQYTSTNANASADVPSVCQNPPSGSVENNVWYEWCAPSNWTPGQNAFLIVNNQVCNSTQGLQLSIYSQGTSCANINAGTATSLVCQNPGSTTNYNYSFAANPNECYLITLDGFAGVSCTYNIMVSGSLCAMPVLSASATNPTVCSGSSTTLSATCSANCTGISYAWTPSSGLSSTSGASVTATPSVTTTYTVSGNIGANCTGTQTVTVTVNQLNTVTSASSNPTICINSAISPVITFTTTGATGIGLPTGLPSGVSASFSGSTISISGTPSASGTFNYSIPLLGGCGTVNATGTITVNSINTVTTASSNPTLCSNSSLSPSITFTTTGATGIGAATGLPTGVSASFSGSTITLTGIPTSSGVFNYSIPLTGGCGALNATGIITVNPTNTVTASSSNPTLCINTNLTPSITFTTTGSTGIGSATGLPAGVSTLFSGNTITLSGTPTNSGTFNYSIPLTGGCGTLNATGTITVNPSNSVTPASSNPTLCVNTTLSPTITFITTGSTGIGVSSGLPSGLTASWFGNTISVNGTPTVSGTFNYSIPLTGGCGSVNATGTITVISLPVISLTPNDPNSCNATDGSIQVSGTGNGTIYWSGPSSGSSSNTLNYTIPNLGAGTYSVYFTNTSGCQSSSLQTSLANPGAPQINIISDVTNCGTSYTLPAVPFVPGTQNNPQYYTGPNGTGTVIAVGTVYNAPTNITLYAYDVNGACSDEEPFTILINEIPSMNPLTSISGCPFSTINPSDFNSTPAGATFTWTNDNIAIGIPSFGNGQITTYNAPANTSNATITGTIAVIPTLNGCTGSSSSFTISILPTPSINAINNLSQCPGTLMDPSDFTSMPSGASFTWNNSNPNIGLASSGNDQIIPFNLASNNTASDISGTISATATLNGCNSNTLTFTISINPTPVITLTPDPPSSCNGTDGSILINGTGSGSISWTGATSGSNNSINLSTNISNLIAGTYDVTFTNALTGCQSSSVSTVITNPGAPIINSISNVSTCNQSFTLPLITGTNLVNPLYFSQPNGTGISYSAGTVINPPFTTTLYAYDANGSCSNEQSFQIQLNPLPVISLSNTNPSLCNLSDGNILVTGIGTGTVNWSGSVNGSSSSTSLDYTVSNLSAGTYSVIFIDDVTGCQSNPLTITLFNPGAPILTNPGNQTACDSYTLPSIIGTNLSGTSSYWTQSGGTGSQFNPGDVITSSSTLYIYDQNGNCSDEESFTVTINTTPSITNPGNQFACSNYILPAITGTNLSGSQGYFTNSQELGGNLISGSINSSQTIYIYDTNGNCSDEESFVITINSLPTATITGGSIYCQGDAISDINASILGTPNYTLNYTIDGVPQSLSSNSNTISLGNTAGTYVLVSVSDGNCTNSNLSSSQTILINTTPNAPVTGTDTSYCANATPIPLFAQGTGSFIWYSDQNLSSIIGTNSTVTPFMNSGTTNYYVTETINGCEGPASIVVVTVENCGIIIPTAFTPDNDLTNDTWVLQNIDQIFPNNRVSIYNRWGNLIFQSNTGEYESNPWDGKYKDQELPVGTYYFIIEYNDNFTPKESGIVCILK